MPGFVRRRVADIEGSEIYERHIRVRIREGIDNTDAAASAARAANSNSQRNSVGGAFRNTVRQFRRLLSSHVDIKRCKVLGDANPGFLYVRHFVDVHSAGITIDIVDWRRDVGLAAPYRFEMSVKVQIQRGGCSRIAVQIGDSQQLIRRAQHLAIFQPLNRQAALIRTTSSPFSAGFSVSTKIGSKPGKKSLAESLCDWRSGPCLSHLRRQIKSPVTLARRLSAEASGSVTGPNQSSLFLC